MTSSFKPTLEMPLPDNQTDLDSISSISDVSLPNANFSPERTSISTWSNSTSENACSTPSPGSTTKKFPFFNKTIKSAATPPPRLPPSSDLMTMEYIPTPKSMGDILKENELPRVVKGESNSAPSVSVPFNICQPLLLYCKRSIRKVGAQSVVFDKSRGRYIETGDDILVPEDYPGWFGVLGSPNKTKIEGCIPHYRSVSRLAISSCTEFLVGGSNCINALTRLSENDQWQKCRILPGTTLRKGNLYQAKKELTKKEAKKKAKSDSKKNKKKVGGGDDGENPVVVAEDLFMSCFDSDEREIIFHGAIEGVFYILAQDGVPLRFPVLQMREILQRYKFPLVVKLLYGSIPSTPCAFQNTLLLTEAGVNQTVIASTINNIRNINLEIPLDTEVLFHLVRNHESVAQCRQYRQALAECKAKVPKYMKNMKVIVGGPSPSSSLSHSASSSSSNTSSSRSSTRSFAPSLPSPASSNSDLQSSPRSSVMSSSDADSYLPDKDTPLLRTKGGSRVSRMSVISRVITICVEDEQIFTPDSPSTPKSPITPHSPSIKGKNALTRQKSKNDAGQEIPNPQKLDEVQLFLPPQSPETIESKMLTERSISHEGLLRRAGFQDKHKNNAYETPNDHFNDTIDEAEFQDSHRNNGYETPNDLFNGAIDESSYQELWVSTSQGSRDSGMSIPQSMNRSSSHASRLSDQSVTSKRSCDLSPLKTSSSAPSVSQNFLCSPGGQLGVQPSQDTSFDNSLPSIPNLIQSGIEGGSKPYRIETGEENDQRNSLNNKITNNNLQPDAVGSIPNSENTTTITDIQSNLDPEKMYHQPVSTTDSSVHVYNELQEKEEPIHSKYNKENVDSKSNLISQHIVPHRKNIRSITGMDSECGYLTPHETSNNLDGYILTGEGKARENCMLTPPNTPLASYPHEEPRAIWRAVTEPTDGFVLFELDLTQDDVPLRDGTLPGSRRIDNGVYKGEDLPMNSTRENDSEKPILSATSSSTREIIYDEPSSSKMSSQRPSYDLPSGYNSVYDKPSDFQTSRDSTYDHPFDVDHTISELSETKQPESVMEELQKRLMNLNSNKESSNQNTHQDCGTVGEHKSNLTKPIPKHPTSNAIPPIPLPKPKRTVPLLPHEHETPSCQETNSEKMIKSSPHPQPKRPNHININQNFTNYRNTVQHTSPLSPKTEPNSDNESSPVSRLPDPDKPPPLPDNHPSKQKSQTEVKSPLEMLGHIRASPSTPSEAKEALIMELNKVGLKASSHLALKSLQAADFVLLAQVPAGDELDNALISLLPNVGQIDLRKIAICIKALGISLTQR